MLDHLSILEMFISSDHSVFKPCFSDREWESFLLIKHQKRQNEWLRGRMLAKYVFLESVLGGSQLQSGHNKSSSISISPDDLKVYSDWLYRQIEVLYHDHPRRSFVNYWWQDKLNDIQLVITHQANVSCVYLSYDSFVGVDLEAYITSREPAFYKFNFSPQEQQWVTKTETNTGIPKMWLFTLIWSIKEAVLKARRDTTFSLWNMAKLDIKIADSFTELYQLWKHNLWLENQATFDVKVNYQKETNFYKTSVLTSKNHMLSISKLKQKP